VQGDGARKNDGAVRAFWTCQCAQGNNKRHVSPHMCFAFMTGPCAQEKNRMRVAPCHAACKDMMLLRFLQLRFFDEVLNIGAKRTGTGYQITRK
jgi:hypothetical protein